MIIDRSSEIEGWFREREDEEFCVLPSTHLSYRHGDFANASTVIYTTKPRCIPRVRSQLDNPGAIAVMGRPGLPNEADLGIIGSASSNVVFIGDADPPDLLVFAWLLDHCSIAWFGVNDRFLMDCGTRFVEGIRVPLSESEHDAIHFVQRVLPSYRDLLGQRCSELWDAGFKIELEGAMLVLDL